MVSELYTPSVAAKEHQNSKNKDKRDKWQRADKLQMGGETFSLLERAEGRKGVSPFSSASDWRAVMWCTQERGRFLRLIPKRKVSFCGVFCHKQAHVCAHAKQPGVLYNYSAAPCVIIHVPRDSRRKQEQSPDYALWQNTQQQTTAGFFRSAV